MIFDTVTVVKYTIDTYKKSRNPLKKIYSVILYRRILNSLSTIKNSIMSFDLLSEFAMMVNTADSDKISSITATNYDYSGFFAQDITIDDDIHILLRHKNRTIQVKYMSPSDCMIDKIYKENIQDNDIIPNKNTVSINNSIRNYIYDFTVSYLRGEFDHGKTT